MNLDKFWSVVDESRPAGRHKWRADTLKEQNKRYEAVLSAMTLSQIIAFRRCLAQCMNKAYRWDLWAAAAIIMGVCTTWDFEDFRAWLIGQGRATYERALLDPESLADNTDLKASDDPQYPAILIIPSDVHWTKSGKKKTPGHSVPTPARPHGKKVVDTRPREESREIAVEIENVQALTARFPRLIKQHRQDEWYERQKPQESNLPPALTKRIAPMAADRFWGLIETSRRAASRKKARDGDAFLKRQMEALSTILGKLSTNEIIAFDLRFGELCSLAYRWDLWGAAYWLHGGCGDDGFIDFRSTLVSLGHKTFERVLADPDSLAEVVGLPKVPFLQTEGFQYVAGRAYTKVTEYDTMPDMPGRKRWWRKAPLGKKFDFENKADMRKRYPRIMAKFPNMGD